MRMAGLLADGSCHGATAAGRRGPVEAPRGLAIVADADFSPDTVGAFPNSELTELASVRAHLPPGAVGWLAAEVAAGGDLEASGMAAPNLLASAPRVLTQATTAR